MTATGCYHIFDMLAEAVVNNLRFPGQYFDAETGLHYNWHRYYAPTTGRYLRVDPIRLKGGVNVYSYALQNPLKYKDSNGKFVFTTGAFLSWCFGIGVCQATILAAGAMIVYYITVESCDHIFFNRRYKRPVVPPRTIPKETPDYELREVPGKEPPGVCERIEMLMASFFIIRYLHQFKRIYGRTQYLTEV
ncbi:MAG: RHS repeat-associated core domain-containing protein [bacterium]|nr:RHS repeat-associated core domain-containing protein [bacterium]